MRFRLLQRGGLALLTCIMGLTCLVAPALAQKPSGLPGNYPAKPIRVIVPVAAGGGSDFVARLISPKLGDALGQPVLIENSAGQFGTIAAARVARSTPDGHMLMFTTPSSQILAHFTIREVPYTMADHTPISATARTTSRSIERGGASPWVTDDT